MTVKQSPFSGNISFNAQHSPNGAAFMSFTCGNFGTRGGIAAQIGRPGNQDLYIGIKEGGRFEKGTLRSCLPFFACTAGGGAGAADYMVEQAGPAEQNFEACVKPYGREQIERRYGWATDAWATREFSFSVFTPFGEIPDPATATPSEMRDALLPAVVAELVVDNRNGSNTVTAFFAINFNEPGWRAVDSGNPMRRGFALRREYGVLGEVLGDDGLGAEAPALFCRWSPDLGIAERVPHLLGSCPGLLMEVPPGERRVLRLAIGCYIAGIVTSDLEGRYLYTNYFGSLEDVLNGALMHGDPHPAAELLDQRLRDSGLSDDQQFLIAHATRSYYGSTQLLDVGGQPFWIVNEGEYCMMNTLDLCVDHMFWELEQNAWVVRNLLDHFVRYYSYVDRIETRFVQATRTSEGGISFTHDMGAHNNFSPRGQSSYELPDLDAVCFSYMTAEQLCNWVLMAATYVAKTGDVNWARQNSYVLLGCLESLCNRGGESAIPEHDSTRCGSGAEITTYDSLDHSLAQTRNSLYMAVKFWASFVGLAMVFERLGEPWQESQAQAMQKAKHAVRTLVRHAGPEGVIPAVFEKDSSGYHSRILPACEGLLYPAAWGMDIAQEFPDLFQSLKRHTMALLTDGQRRNLFADGGIKLSSTSSNSWMSKIAIFQEIARHVFRLSDESAVASLFEIADRTHVKWQTDGSGYWACSDQFVDGVAKGSRWYPRVITTALWLDHSGKHEPRGDEAALAGDPQTKR